MRLAEAYSVAKLLKVLENGCLQRCNVNIATFTRGKEFGWKAAGQIGR